MEEKRIDLTKQTPEELQFTMQQAQDVSGLTIQLWPVIRHDSLRISNNML